MSDLISRQAAIEAIDKHLRTTDVPVSYPGIVSALTEWLNELPPAQPNSKESSFTRKALDNDSPSAQPEPAMWLMDGIVHGEVMHRCSECGEQEHVPLVMGLPSWRYCPNCGRKMEANDD